MMRREITYHLLIQLGIVNYDINTAHGAWKPFRECNMRLLLIVGLTRRSEIDGITVIVICEGAFAVPGSLPNVPNLATHVLATAMSYSS
jgi:hypothetical protein